MSSRFEFSTCLVGSARLDSSWALAVEEASCTLTAILSDARQATIRLTGTTSALLSSPDSS